MVLLDHNLSHKLEATLEAVFPGCVHVRSVQLERSPDREVWQYALEHDLTIVTKDNDFIYLLNTLGFPPKVVWLRCGNVSTVEIQSILQDSQVVIKSFIKDDTHGLLELGLKII